MARAQLTDEQAEEVRAGHARGESQTSIARRLGIERSTISRWSKREGLVWSGIPTEATKAAKERIDAARMQLAEAALADALAIRQRLWDEHTMVVNTPAGPQRVTLDLPDAKAVAEYAAAIERCTKVHEHLAPYLDRTNLAHIKGVLLETHELLVRFASEADGDDLSSLEPPTPTDEELDREWGPNWEGAP
jgi:transposase-like protein